MVQSFLCRTFLFRKKVFLLKLIWVCCPFPLPEAGVVSRSPPDRHKASVMRRVLRRPRDTLPKNVTVKDEVHKIMIFHRLNCSKILSAFRPVALGVAVLLVALDLFVGPQLTNAAGPDSADVVVKFSPGDTIARRVTFTAPISGLAALQLTGLDVITSDLGWGIAVCAINGVGRPADNCFETVDDGNPANDGYYWGYMYWDGAAWQSYWVGAPDSVVNNGAVEGWQWGAWGDAPISPAPPITAAVKALNWLKTRQQADGGFGAPGVTAEAMLAIGANGYNTLGWQGTAMPGSGLFDYWAADDVPGDGFPSNAAKYAGGSIAAAANLALASLSMEQDPTHFAGLNLVISMTRAYSPATGSFGPNNIDQARAILAWRALYTNTTPAPPKALQLLATNVATSGGWAWSPGVPDADTNTTALALQAFAAGGWHPASPVIQNGLNFLKAAQNSDGGFYSNIIYGADSDVDSTAYVVQALLAVGEDPAGPRWTKNGQTPFDYMLGMQSSDGSFPYSMAVAGPNLLATVQAVPALLGKPFAYHALPAVKDGIIVVPAEGGVVHPQPGVTITIEGGDFDRPVIIRYTALSASGGSGSTGSFGSFQPSGVFYQLNAYDYDNPSQPVALQPGQSYSITLFYGDDAGGLFEPSLVLYYWDGSQWALESSAVLDIAAQTITATPNHFSDWIILGDKAYTVYMPVVIK